MPAASSRIPLFRSAEYWAALEAIADELVDETVAHPQSPPVGARGALKRLSSRGFGHLSLFDLCCLLVLAAPRAPESPDAGVPVPETLPPTKLTPASASADPIAELKRGPVTMATHPTERHRQHLRDLEAAVAEAWSVRREHPRARSAVRRALMARGSTIHDATAVYGIVCELITRASHTP